jgi:hypothetical protein
MGAWLQPHLIVVLFILGIPFVLALWVVPLWFVCRKAGFSPWLTLLNCIPFGTPILLYLLAFADWRGARTADTSSSGPAVSPDRQSDRQSDRQPIRGPQLVIR